MTKRMFAPVLLAVLLLAPGCSKEKERAKGNPAAPPAPEFHLSAVEGGKALSLADYKGKVLVLNFWATWCPPCKQEIPAFNDLYVEYRDDGLEFLGVSVDQGGLDAVKTYYDSNPGNPAVPAYPVAMANESIVRAYNSVQPLSSIPTTFLIDREGRIQKVIVGSRMKAEFEMMFTSLL